MSYIDFFLCKCISFTYRLEALSLLDQLLSKSDIDNETKMLALQLKKSLGSPNSIGLTNASQIPSPFSFVLSSYVFHESFFFKKKKMKTL